MGGIPWLEGLRGERIRASAQWEGGADGRFRNTDRGLVAPRPSLSVMRDFFFKRGRRVPRVPLPVDDPTSAWARGDAGRLRTTWLGHSTVLLELGGRRVLTDPVFGLRASPLSWMGPRRFHPTPVEVDALPPLDAVLLSHDHYDHLCVGTMTALAKRGVPVVTPLGVGHRLERLGWAPEKVHELDWGEAADIAGIRFTAAPAQHFSGRGVRDRDRTLWASFVIESDTARVFFSGDSGLTSEFEAVGRAHGPFDLIMMEVGAWHEAWGTIHLGAVQAVAAFEMLGGGALLPVHWGTFNLALHDWDAPAEELSAIAEARGLRVLTPRLGEVLVPERVADTPRWWRGLEASR
jgi:L-ascorbate metabolism protein UlaG (beta-lactamase superfamily)